MSYGGTLSITNQESQDFVGLSTWEYFSFTFFFLFPKYMYLFIYLAVLVLSFNMQDL